MSDIDDCVEDKKFTSLSIFLPAKEVLEQLGEMIVLFQRVERALRWLGCTILNSDDSKLGHIILNQLSFSKMVSVVQALAVTRFDQSLEHLKKLDELMKKCTAAEKRRNQLTHSDWGRVPEFPDLARRKKATIGKAGLSIREERLDSHAIREFNGELEILFSELVAAMDCDGLALVQRDAENY